MSASQPADVREPDRAAGAPRLQLVSSATCPFAQRTRMALLEKDLPFAFTEISLDDKPDWFVALSPYGKVPLLRDGDVVLYESAVINEYLEEVFPEPALMPADPAGRARARIWIDFANVRLIPFVYRLMMAQEPDAQTRQAARLTEALDRMEDWLGGLGAGPYWLGEALTLADLSFYPHLERFCALEHYRGFRIPDAHVRLRDWLTLMRARPSAEAVARTDEIYIRNWGKYARGGGQGATARDMRET